MSFETITVYRDFPIINGYVQLPPNHEADKTAFTPDEVLLAVSGSERKRLAHPDTNPNTGRKFGSQEFIRVPGQTFSIDV